MIMCDSFADIISTENTGRVRRPSLAQLKAVVEFIEKHPELDNKYNVQNGINDDNFQELWANLLDTLNSIAGTRKTMRGWIKFWTDKKMNITIKNRKINQGKLHDRLTPLEQRILKLCKSLRNKEKIKVMKQEPTNGDDSFVDDTYLNNDIFQNGNMAKVLPTEQDERSFNVMDTMIDAMDKQATALSQMAQASLTHSKAMEKIAEESHKQAVAVDRLTTTFESICGSVYEVRNAVMGINYTFKGLYSANTQNRQNSHLFS